MTQTGKYKRNNSRKLVLITVSTVDISESILSFLDKMAKWVSENRECSYIIRKNARRYLFKESTSYTHKVCISCMVQPSNN